MFMQETMPELLATGAPLYLAQRALKSILGYEVVPARHADADADTEDPRLVPVDAKGLYVVRLCRDAAGSGANYE